MQGGLPPRRLPVLAQSRGVSSGSWTLQPSVGMIRIPPPGAGATRMVPRKISRRMMAWTSGRWAFAWMAPQSEVADSRLIPMMWHTNEEVMGAASSRIMAVMSSRRR